MEIPECCFVCKYEKPPGHCELLNIEIHNDNGLFCPPGICPLRKEDWPAPSEKEFKKMAEEDPEKLSRWIKNETLEASALTYAAEILGKSSLCVVGKIKTLLPLLNHSSPLVREGAIYGLESSVKEENVVKRLEAIAELDPSPGVRSAAKEALED